MDYNSYSARFGAAVKTTTSGGNSGGKSAGGFFGSKKTTVTVQDATGTGVMGFLQNIFKSEKQVTIEPRTAQKANITIKDYTGAGAYNTLTGNVPESRYEATQVGEKVIVRETANSGSSWWNILTGNK
jgi:hypothetical protein